MGQGQDVDTKQPQRGAGILERVEGFVCLITKEFLIVKEQVLEGGLDFHRKTRELEPRVMVEYNARC